MAFNNWDKLEKAQRDYPKAKFAVGVVDKALKKQANNPYLLVRCVVGEVVHNTDDWARHGRRILRCNNVTLTWRLSLNLYLMSIGSQSMTLGC
jgi:hypothetical protein